MVTPSVMIRLDCQTADLDSARPSQTIENITSDSLQTYIRFRLIEVSPTSFESNSRHVIYFRGYAGPAIAESAVSPILCSRNDLHIAEFFESVFAEFNANP
jgi:hypothetical protein